MRIVVVSPFLPWPLESGGKAAVFSTLKSQAADHDFTLVSPVHGERGRAHAREMAAELPQIRVRAVECGGAMTPSKPRRWMQRALGFAQRAINPPPAPASLPSYPFHPLPAPLVDAIGEELERGTDLVQAEFAPTLPLGPWLPRAVPRLFIHHQVHFVYAQRFIEAHGDSAAAGYLHAMMRVQELAYLRHFDAVITFSEEDRQALLAHLPAGSVFASPFPIPADVGMAKEISNGFDGRFLFVASEKHDPNRDGLEWLLAEIWPKILGQLPSARLAVVGQWSRAARERLAGPGVSFTGFVSDLAATMRGGIMLVPLRIGSGIRVKILVALAQGVPVVTTPVGVEGLLVRDGAELLVRGGAAEFAEGAVRLARDADLRRRLAEAGRDAVSKHYAPENVRRRRNEIYEAVVAKRRCEAVDLNSDRATLSPHPFPLPEGEGIASSRTERASRDR